MKAATQSLSFFIFNIVEMRFEEVLVDIDV